ncbi:MAG: divalent cation tolerance protein CutA [Pseudomonadota bacterium]
MTDLIELKSTYEQEAPALAMAKALVERKLAACVHVSGPVISAFVWDGAPQLEPEWMLTAKTRADLFEAAAAAISEAHPYDLPCITATPMTATAAFRDWVVRETGG